MVEDPRVRAPDRSVPSPPGFPREEMLEVVIDISEDVIFTCTAGGLIDSWSRKAERLTGYEASRAHGQPLTELFSPRLRDSLARVVGRALAGERVRRFESEMLRPDGLTVPVSLAMAQVGPAGLAVVLRDMTEQRLDQAALGEMDRRRQEAEALAHIGSWLLDAESGVGQRIASTA